jgi:hypothetical protein
VNNYHLRRYVDADFKTAAKEALVLKDADRCFIRPGGK